MESETVKWISIIVNLAGVAVYWYIVRQMNMSMKAHRAEIDVMKMEHKRAMLSHYQAIHALQQMMSIAHEQIMQKHLQQQEE